MGIMDILKKGKKRVKEEYETHSERRRAEREAYREQALKSAKERGRKKAKEKFKYKKSKGRRFGNVDLDAFGMGEVGTGVDYDTLMYGKKKKRKR